MAKQKNDGQATMQSKNERMFYFVKDKDGKIVICVGGYAMSEKRFDDFEHAERYVSSKPWELIVNLCYLILKKNETIKEMPQDK